MSNVEIIEPAKPEAPAPPAPWTITCESGDCPVAHAGHGTYRESWQSAYDDGWRTDLSGVRRCPPCVAERQPVITIWLAGQALTGYLARKVPPAGDLEAQQVQPVPMAPVAPAAPPVQVIPDPEPGSVTAAERFADASQRTARQQFSFWTRGQGEPSGAAPDPGSPEALAAYQEVSNQIHRMQQDAAADAAGEPAETTVIPAVSAETETFAPVTEGDA